MTTLVPIDRSLWSRSSQRSSGGQYDSNATHYEGIRYRCRSCEASCVFSAEEQKLSYEVNKKFVSWLPSLCPSCHVELIDLQNRDRVFQQEWVSARKSLAGDLKFLESWLAVLQALKAHGKPNESMERMLVRRIRELPSQPSNAA